MKAINNLQDLMQRKESMEHLVDGGLDVIPLFCPETNCVQPMMAVYFDTNHNAIVLTCPNCKKVPWVLKVCDPDGVEMVDVESNVKDLKGKHWNIPDPPPGILNKLSDMLEEQSKKHCSEEVAAEVARIGKKLRTMQLFVDGDPSINNQTFQEMCNSTITILKEMEASQKGEMLETLLTITRVTVEKIASQYNVNLSYLSKQEKFVQEFEQKLEKHLSEDIQEYIEKSKKPQHGGGHNRLKGMEEE